MALPANRDVGWNPEVDLSVKGAPGPHPDVCAHEWCDFAPLGFKCFKCGWSTYSPPLAIAVRDPVAAPAELARGSTALSSLFPDPI